jgi:tetratricopeptide (TPR) repeat protein
MLMRVENEAQLAYVLAHEISHFERRHSLQQWRDTKIKSDGLIFVELLSAAAGAGYVGNLARLIAVSSMFAFSRNQEEEADLRGFELARQAGYDVREASEVWRNLLEEEALEKQRSRQLIFFSSHPATAARLETLRGLAEGTTSDFDGRERLREILLPVRAEFIREELRSGRFERTQWLLSRMVESGSALGEIEFYRGELHRYRAEPGDEDKALDFYRSATEQEGAPPEAFRQIGLIHRRRGETKQAGLAFESYLQLAPNASDHKMIESYLAPRETQP